MSFYDNDTQEMREDANREYLIDGVGFARPDSALRAATRRNPRSYPCPTCKEENCLTRLDMARHYQCDACADHDEYGF
jgi:hypothetical protein